MSRRNSTIDLCKYIFSLMIIGIHTNLLFDVNPKVSFCLHIVFSMAVPFFAVCSGYFLSRAIARKGFSAVRKQEKKIICIYAVWTVLYLLYSIPEWIGSGWFSAWAFADFFIAVFRSASHYHLWYLISLIYALPLFYLCLRFIKNRRILFVLMFELYLVKALVYAYWGMLTGILGRLGSLFYVCPALSDAVFLILPLLLAGFFIAEGKRPGKKTSAVCLAVSFALLCCET